MPRPRPAEAARRVGGNCRTGARPLRLVRELRPALPYRRRDRRPRSLLLRRLSIGKTLAVDVRTGHEVLRIDRDRAVEVRELADGRTSGSPTTTRAVPRAEPCGRRCRARTTRGSTCCATSPNGPHHRPARGGRPARRGRRRQLHRAGADRGLPGRGLRTTWSSGPSGSCRGWTPRWPGSGLPRRAPTMWTCGWASATRPPRRGGRLVSISPTARRSGRPRCHGRGRAPPRGPCA